jgi:hypothetical protein
VNAGAHLPILAKEAGFAIEEVHPAVKFGRPGDATWRWITDYFMGVMDRYAGCPPFSKQDAARLKKHWAAAQRCSTSLLVSPTVLDVVARKRG